jgi:Recombinase zinc beta ribbon domain
VVSASGLGVDHALLVGPAEGVGLVLERLCGTQLSIHEDDDDRWGQQNQHARPEIEWMRVPAPHLQIVSDGQWRAAQARREARTPRHPAASPVVVRSRDVDAKYLLTGFGRCALCGGAWRGHTRDHGREQVRFYGCANHAKRGARVCSNGLVARTAAIDAEVLATLAEDVLRPTVINQAIALALDELAPAGADRAGRAAQSPTGPPDASRWPRRRPTRRTSRMCGAVPNH